MKVSELIQALKKMPQDYHVRLDLDGGQYDGPAEVVEIDKMETFGGKRVRRKADIDTVTIRPKYHGE